MSRVMGIALLAILVWGLAAPALAQGPSNEELLRELQELKSRVQELEGQLQKQAPPPAGGTAVGSRPATPAAEGEGAAPAWGQWFERIHLSGLIEVEANYERLNPGENGLDTEDSSDLVLATVELGVDVDIAEHVSGHLLFLWEEDETEPVDLDEGFITLDGKDVVPLYLSAGKMYVPFGWFETHMVSDPLTLEIGETNETAVKVGLVQDWLELAVSAFNGDVDETGEDNHIRGFAVGAFLTLPEGKIPDLTLGGGVSYISNIADSDGLTDVLDEEFGIDTIESRIDGIHAYGHVGWQERVFLQAEYVAALDAFEDADLGFIGERFEPRAWNVELAVVPLEDWEVAVRWEGSDDTLSLLPETQYGAAVRYRLFDHTTLALEYLRGEFDNDDRRDLVTSQLAVEF